MDTHARAVQTSYTYAKSGQEAAKKYVATNLPGYHVHEGLSDNHSVVLHDPSTNHVIVAYRGTMLSPLHHPLQTAQDLKADAEIALGLHHVHTIPREAEAELKYHRVSSVFPDARITTSGHSLGGVQSYHVATKYNLEGHHFNMGESPLPGVATFNTLHGLAQKDDRQHIYHSDNYKALGNIYNGSDPISSGTKELPGTHHTIKVNAKTDLDAHDLRHFISRSKEQQEPKEPKRAPRQSEKPRIQSTDLVDVQAKKKRHKKYVPKK